MENNEVNVVVVDGWLLFADGHMRENTSYMGVTKYPDSETEKRKLQKLFWEKKLELCIAEFDDRKAMLLGDVNARLKQNGNPGGCPVSTEEAIGVLTELKSRVQHAREMLSEAEQNLINETPKEVVKAQSIAEENRQRLGDFADAVKQIEI